MKNKDKFLGFLLRQKRLLLEMEQKDLAQGICAVSYLSKIERGQAKASDEIIELLLARLDLEYEQDADFLNQVSAVVGYLFEGIFFNNEISEEREFLKNHEKRIRNSPYFLSYEILKAYYRKEAREDLANFLQYMDDREKGIYWTSLIQMQDYQPLELASQIAQLLNNSFGKLIYMRSCLENNQFEKIKELGAECLDLALFEGNLHSLIHGNMLLATSYASQGHLAVALPYYQRAHNLMKNSNWSYLENDINYNLGSAYLLLGNLEDAEFFLEQVDRSYGFYLYHKLAYLALAKADMKKAKEEISAMAREIAGDQTKLLIYNVSCMQLQENYEANSTSLQLIEQLIEHLSRAKHIGYLRFHRSVITKVFIAHRKYKQAFEFEQLLNNASLHAPN